MLSKELLNSMVDFEFCCGNYCRGYKYLKIKLKNDKIIKTNFTKSKKNPEIEQLMTKEEFEKFKDELYKYIKNWTDLYYDDEALDGEQWSVDIICMDGLLHYYGSNDYPINWKSFLKFMKKMEGN